MNTTTRCSYATSLNIQTAQPIHILRIACKWQMLFPPRSVPNLIKRLHLKLLVINGSRVGNADWHVKCCKAETIVTSMSLNNFDDIRQIFFIVAKPHQMCNVLDWQTNLENANNACCWLLYEFIHLDSERFAQVGKIVYLGITQKHLFLGKMIIVVVTLDLETISLNCFRRFNILRGKNVNW